MARQSKRKRKQPEDEAFTRSDFARIAGVLLLLVAGLMLTTTPEMLQEAWYRDGYVDTTARITRTAVHGGALDVQILPNGDKFTISRMGPTDASPEPVRVHYNRDARLMFTFGDADTPLRITLFDSRVLPWSEQPLPTVALASTVLTLNLLALAGSLQMIFQPRWRRRGRRVAAVSRERA